MLYLTYPEKEVKIQKMLLFSRNFKGKKGQHLIEYALIASVVSAAVIAMSTYVFRSVQAAQQNIQKKMQE
jgi:Flp pilus assembly pilin Flp